MKKLITISLFIFWAVVVAILTAGLVFYQNNKNINGSSYQNYLVGNNLDVIGGSGADTNLPGNQSGVSATKNLGQVSTLSLTEIAKHNKSSDCWLLINNKVYNVSSYISAHPGGAGTIISSCGKESTQLYNTKGGNNPHSSNANNMLAAYYVGNLNQQTSQQQIQQTVQNTNAIVLPPGRGGDDEGGEDD